MCSLAEYQPVSILEVMQRFIERNFHDPDSEFIGLKMFSRNATHFGLTYHILLAIHRVWTRLREAIGFKDRMLQYPRLPVHM